MLNSSFWYSMFALEEALSISNSKIFTQDLDNDDEWMSDEEEMEFEREQQARMRQRPQSPSSDEEPARPPSDMSSSDDEGFTYQRSDANRRTGGGQPPNMQEPGQAEMGESCSVSRHRRQIVTDVRYKKSNH